MTRGQLNAGHLGGRFLKRAFPQKVKPVLPYVTENDGVVDQSKQALSEGSRRSRTSAAMIGLAAISMGAQSLLLVHQGEEAIAAEPLPSEPAAATPSTFDLAALSSGEDAASPAQSSGLAGTRLIEHIVQEGETLWQLAQSYKVDAVTVATLNGVPLNTVLRVGQVLRFPVDTRVASAVTPEAAERPIPSYYGLIEKVEVKSSVMSEAATSEVAPSDATLKLRQDQALDELKQKREDLRVSLSRMKAVHQEPQVLNQSTDPQSQLTEGTGTHRVVIGDTLSAIARAHGISQRKLAQANGITNPDVIRVNQVLVIPQDGTASLTQQPSSANKSLAVPNLCLLYTSPSPRDRG
jgi:LysM repeat protein